MSSLIRKIYKSEILWKLLKKGVLNDLCIPCYHVVNDNPQAHIKNLFPIISKKNFEKNLSFLGNNYNFISPNELFESLKKNVLPENKCILTFDDGYRECFDVVYPLLKQKGIPAIFFITRDFVDNTTLSHFNKISLILERLKSNTHTYIAKQLLEVNSLFTGDLIKDIRKLGLGNIELIDKLGSVLEINFLSYLKEIKPYLSQNQIKEIHDNGFGIGAHSNNHQRFIELNKDQQLLQINQSLEFVESITHENTPFFAFPYSSYGFNPELYNEFPDVLFFDTLRAFQKSNSKISQRFIMDIHESIKSKLLETRLKKLSYIVRMKNIPHNNLYKK